METRKERDSFGEIEVPASAFYGAQTARSLIHFNIGRDRMPESVIKAFGLLKKACAEVNCELGLLSDEKMFLIARAALEVASGQLAEHFPLSIWQTGSGTQTNMNVNEVIAYRAREMGGKPVHPNDDVNMSQSSNDTFPAAMHIAAVQMLINRVIPMAHKLREALQEKVEAFEGIVKIGRTHLMDAVSLTLGEEFSGYVAQLDLAIERLEWSLPRLYELAIGGTAVGTGMNAPADFSERVCEKLSGETQLPFVSAPNKFAALASHEPLIAAHGALKTLAIALTKIASDLSLLGSGPRCGLGELKFPQNEPGSSIMPGKVNPTQCEALLMICCHVMGNDAAMSIAGARGNFELNVYKPMLIHNFLDSAVLLADGMRSFSEHFVQGLEANREQIQYYLERSLMHVTALAPVIGYDRAAQVAHKAYQENLTIKEACLALGFLSEEEFARLFPLTAGSD